MNRELIKALLNKAVTTGSWELRQERLGMSHITINLSISDAELQVLDQEHGRKLTQLFKSNGSRKFKFNED